MYQDILQRKIDQTCKNCMNCRWYTSVWWWFNLWSTSTWGKGENQVAGIKSNFEKYIIKSKSCSFLGHIYTPHGVKPDQKKIQAVTQMQVSSTKQEFNYFLGMVNYLSQFIPAMSDLTSNLRRLPKSNNSCDACLQYFIYSKPVMLHINASKRGWGAVFIPKVCEGWDKPIVHALKSSTSAENKYANTEWEMLTVVFGCMKFHHYWYGWKFMFQSHHNPLEDIHLMYLNDAPPRLQGLLLKI